MKVEYSRILIKRSSTSGVVPTIPNNEDDINTWETTDLYEGELFLNLRDDRLFVRTMNGITEIQIDKRNGNGLYGITDAGDPSNDLEVIQNGFRGTDGIPFVPIISRVSTGTYTVDFTGAMDSDGIQVDHEKLLLNVQPTGGSESINSVVFYSGGSNTITIVLSDTDGIETDSTFNITVRGKIG